MFRTQQVPLSSAKHVSQEMAQLLTRAYDRLPLSGQHYLEPVPWLNDYLRYIRVESQYCANPVTCWNGFAAILLKQVTKCKLVYKEDGPGKQRLIAPDLILQELYKGQTVYTDCKSMSVLVAYLFMVFMTLINKTTVPVRITFELLKYPGKSDYSHVRPTLYLGSELKVTYDLAYTAQQLQIGYYPEAKPDTIYNQVVTIKTKA